MEIRKPYLLFLGDVTDPLGGKIARGIADWRPAWCAGQWRLEGCVADTGLPETSLPEALERGAATMVVGVANAGGFLPDNWVPMIVDALDAGLDVAAGLHRPLRSVPAIADAAARTGRQLHDVRLSDRVFETGTGAPRSGRRLLTVGTDCSVGKKYTALALERDMKLAGFRVDYRATGQTGVLISERGVAIDAVPSDFIAGAAEWLSPANDPDHWDVIEGQGSLFHPSFAGVTLGLLHGSQPDAFVVCTVPDRRIMRHVSHPMPSIADVIDRTVIEGRLTSPGICCVGISVNTVSMDDEVARELLDSLAEGNDLPAVDAIRYGCGPIVDELRRRFAR